jgi:hypothetical protein
MLEALAKTLPASFTAATANNQSVTIYSGAAAGRKLPENVAAGIIVLTQLDQPLSASERAYLTKLGPYVLKLMLIAVAGSPAELAQLTERDTRNIEVYISQTLAQCGYQPASIDQVRLTSYDNAPQAIVEAASALEAAPDRAAAEPDRLCRELKARLAWLKEAAGQWKLREPSEIDDTERLRVLRELRVHLDVLHQDIVADHTDRTSALTAVEQALLQWTHSQGTPAALMNYLDALRPGSLQAFRQRARDFAASLSVASPESLGTEPPAPPSESRRASRLSRTMRRLTLALVIAGAIGIIVNFSTLSFLPAVACHVLAAVAFLAALIGLIDWDPRRTPALRRVGAIAAAPPSAKPRTIPSRIVFPDWSQNAEKFLVAPIDAALTISARGIDRDIREIENDISAYCR